MVLAVTGITGHSGSFMLQKLIDNKFDGTLRCMVRETSNTKKLDESGLKVEKVVGSTKNPDDLLRLVSGADTIMHISGIWETLGLLEAVEKSGGKPHILLVHTSAIHCVYEEDLPQITAEYTLQSDGTLISKSIVTIHLSA